MRSVVWRCRAYALLGPIVLMCVACASGANRPTPPSSPPAVPIATKATIGPVAVSTTAGSPIALTSTAVGTVLSTAGGRTLYIYTPDRAAPGKSTVYGQLADAWPPMYTGDPTPPSVRGANGVFSVITRDDGSRQIAYNGMPLYLYRPDKAPGDTFGDQLGAAWFVARP